MAKDFSPESASKTLAENTFLNLQSFLFIGSGFITRLLFYTPVTPHQVIFVSMVFGISASYLFLQNQFALVCIGAVLLFYKNVLDKVDGSLARAKGLDSRRGRFYDSISDFIVTLCTFSAMSYKLYLVYNTPWIFAIGFAAMMFSMLQCSYFIFYQVAFIKLSGKVTINRLIETVTEEDLVKQDKWTIFLQRIFLLIYGWQDMLFASIDNLMYKRLELRFSNLKSPQGESNNALNAAWYSNKPFLTMASTLSIGTQVLFTCIFAIAGRFDIYFFVNLILWNLLLIFTIIYHYITTIRKLRTL